MLITPGACVRVLRSCAVLNVNTMRMDFHLTSDEPLVVARVHRGADTPALDGWPLRPTGVAPVLVRVPMVAVVLGSELDQLTAGSWLKINSWLARL
jgi:hypothetical protein